MLRNRTYAFAPDGRVIEEPLQHEIVMCKDCKWHDNPDESPRWIPCLKIRTKDDWFCGDGERADT